MTDKSYEQLADALDALPNGYPRVPSGREIRLLKKAFTPEEAWLAGHMSRAYETAEEISRRAGLPEISVTGHMSRAYETAEEISHRAGLPEDSVKHLLAEMLPRHVVRRKVVDGIEKFRLGLFIVRWFDTRRRGLRHDRKLLDKLLSSGLVRRKSVDGIEKYRLGPFIFGWYESMMGRLRHDKEFAEIFEQYLIEGAGDRILSPRPGILGVVPARGSLKPDLLQPYDDIDAHFSRYERFGVIDCVCKLERDLVGGSCPMPLKRCGFYGLPPQTPLSENVLDRDQAMALFQKLEEKGLVHLGFYGFIYGADTPQFVGCCNCCGDCCGILRGNTDLNLEEGVQRSNYRAVIDHDNCARCGNCIDLCQVKAITEDSEGLPELNRDKCIGCGACVIGCPGDAIELVPVSRDEWFDVPSSFEEWEERRLANLESK